MDNTVDWRNVVDYIVNVVLTISFLLVFVTGLIKFMVLYRIFGSQNMLLPHYLMSAIHDWSGVMMGILVFIHLALHVRWMIAMTKRFFRRGSPKVTSIPSPSQHTRGTGQAPPG